MTKKNKTKIRESKITDLQKVTRVSPRDTQIGIVGETIVLDKVILLSLGLLHDPLLQIYIIFGGNDEKPMEEYNYKT